MCNSEKNRWNRMDPGRETQPTLPFFGRNGELFIWDRPMPENRNTGAGMGLPGQGRGGREQ